MKEFKALIKGRVQMVGFRYFTVKKASQLGIKGYVKNLPSGEVEVVAQGSAGDLESLVGRIKKGPARSEVRETDINYREPEKEYTGFNVRY